MYSFLSSQQQIISTFLCEKAHTLISTMPSSNSNSNSKHSSSSSKKQSSKSKSRLQSSIPDAASTPPRTTTIQLDSLLQHASRIFPSFISHSASVAEIIDIESTDSLSKGAAKIWLSESSMVASSLAPGSLVSVILFSWNYYSAMVVTYDSRFIYFD